jgi:hypothetical protein
MTGSLLKDQGSTVTKFSWELLDSGSLLLRIADGDRETTWKITKRTPITRVRNIFWEMESALDELTYERIPGMNARPTQTELDALTESWEAQSTTAVQADTEEASRAAQAARAAQLSATAQWWNNDDEESMFVAALPDYDAGEI